jgi:DNA-binding XRE family transcriptional regulator
MPASRPIDELRRHAGKLIANRASRTTIAKAAAELGISRQALYDIRKGRYCPSLALIHRACEVWGLEFKFRNLTVGKKTLQLKRAPQQRLPIQSGLFDALELLEKRELRVVRAKRVGETVELVLHLKMPA